MKKSHENLKIGSADFNRLVEVLQDTLDARGVPFATQRELLARLAPMHRDIITRP
jgi:hemoglobin